VVVVMSEQIHITRELEDIANELFKVADRIKNVMDYLNDVKDKYYIIYLIWTDLDGIREESVASGDRLLEIAKELMGMKKELCSKLTVGGGE
jgi:hypothetical protein